MKRSVPLCIVSALAFDDPLHKLRVPEQGDCKLPIYTHVDAPGQNLVDEVVSHTVKEVIPREVKEKILVHLVRASLFHENKGNVPGPPKAH